MNIRQQKYKKNRLDGLSAYKAAIKAGYTHATAWNAHKNIEKRCNMQELFLKAGIDDECIIALIQEGMNAKRPVACDIFIRDKNGKLTVNKNSNDWIEYEDWANRHKFLLTTLQLLKKIEDKPLIDQSQHTHFVVFRNPQAIQEIRKETKNAIDRTDSNGNNA